MYKISAILEQDRSVVALYGNEYKLLAKKNGSASDLSKLCLDVVAEGGIQMSDVESVGVAVAPACGCPIARAKELKSSLGVSCIGAPLVNAKALGEAALNKDTLHLIMLTMDETMESAIVIDKKIYAGVKHLGGKIAHMAVNFGGYACSCGQKGCLEAYVCNAGLKHLAKDAGVANAETLTHKALFDMTTPEAEQAKAMYVSYLASGITNIINLFQPNELVLEGSLTEAGDKLLKPTMDIVLREQYTRSLSTKCNVRFANVQEDTALLGAALLEK